MNGPFLRSVLRSYQERAATFLFERDAALVIAPLGAGKGAAALTALAELIRDEHRRHALVIAPKLVATTVWPQEVASWRHLAHLRIAVLDGSPKRRRELLAAAPEREVTVIGVDLVPWLVAELVGFADDHPLFDALTIDQTSRLKDPSGKRARTLTNRHTAAEFESRPLHAHGHHHRQRAVGPPLRALAGATLPLRARVGGAAGGRSPPTSRPSQ
jgi:hypothetical protein